MAETLYIPEHYAQCLLRFRLTGDPEEMAITIGVYNEAEDDDAENVALQVRQAADAAGSIVGAASNYYTQWTYVGATAHLTSAGGVITGEDLVNTSGTASGETLPVNTALLVKKNTGVGGQTGRGRCYMPMIGLSEDDVNNIGVIASGEITSQQNRWNVFLAALASNAVPAYLFHYPYKQHPLTVPPVIVDPTPAPTIITSFSVQAQVATQRTRLRR